MPKNKNAVSRYKLINQMLLNGKAASKQAIANACYEKLGIDISLRTIENDIFSMRYSEGLGYFAPIYYNNSKMGYIYADPDYSIDKIPVDDADLNKLRFAASLLRQYGRVNAFQEYSGVIDKVVRLINYRKLQSGGGTLDFIEFEKNPPVKGMEFIDQLIPLIRKKQVVKISHHSFWQNEVNAFTLHPFYLKEYKFRWYLVAYCEERDDLRIYGLERIESIDVEPLKPFTSKLFNPEVYFEKFIGVNVPEGGHEKVVLRFKNNIGKYILTQPIQSSQKLIREDGEIYDFEYMIGINQEFIGIILSWGENVEVLEPETFRETIKARLEKSLKPYIAG
ncbi:MAG: WYL domain-containing protein [Bacteroidales bacterium]|nr:WYL domain-containing protein [Bacteroidales bacterium]